MALLTTKAFAANAQNEYLFGLPQMAADAGVLPRGTFSPALEDKAVREELNREHETAAFLGTTAGVIANLLTPGLNMGGGAGKVASLTERGLAKVGLEAGESLTRQAVVGALKEGARGATYAAPRALGTLVLQDEPTAAGEILLTGVGIGAMFGAAAPLASRAGAFANSAAKSGAAKLAEKGITKADLASKGARWAAEKGAEATGGLLGGWPGWLASRAVAPALGAAAEAAGRSEAAVAFVTRLAEHAGTALDGLAPSLAKIGSGAGTRAYTAASTTAVAKLLSGKGSDQITALAADPEKRAESIGRLTEGLEDLPPHVRHSLAAQANVALDYLNSAAPKGSAGASAGMFAGKQVLPADPVEERRFGRRLQVVINPLAAISGQLLRGTLTRDHVEALDAVYPALAAEMRARVIEAASDPKAPRLTRAQKAQLEVLMGGAISPSTRPEAVAGYQSVYSAGNQAANDPGLSQSKARTVTLKKLPSSMTEAQRKEFGR